METLPLLECSDDFVFDNQMLAQAALFGFRIGELSCPTKYFKEASSINFRRSTIYGLGVLRTSLQYRLHAAHPETRKSYSYGCRWRCSSHSRHSRKPCGATNSILRGN